MAEATVRGRALSGTSAEGGFSYKRKNTTVKIMSQEQFTSDLLDFIEGSPTPFHAVQSMVSMLRDNGFAELKESAQWSLLPGQNYYVTRNDSSIIAFRTGSNDVLKSGVRMVGAHTDSPCLKVKPSPEITQKGYMQLGVEVYGGVLLNTSYDRDLTLDGKIVYKDNKNNIKR